MLADWIGGDNSRLERSASVVRPELHRLAHTPQKPDGNCSLKACSPGSLRGPNYQLPGIRQLSDASEPQSAVSRLNLDDVGIRACPIAIVCSYPIVIDRTWV